MKIEIEINDINRDEVIERMAARLLGFDYQRDDDPDSPDPTPEIPKWDGKQIGKHLRKYFEARIKETVDTLVSEAVDQTIRDAVAAEVKAICTEGWQTTDEYGRPKDTKTLKGIVLDALITPAQESRYSSNRSTVAERVARDTIEEQLKRGFQAEIDAAQKRFREQVDVFIQAKFTETIKAALGLR